MGILHKPILLAREGNSFDILCGFKRLLFALSITHQIECVECLVFAKDIEAKIILDTLLTEQSLSKPLSLAEKARFVEICSRFLSHRDIVSVYLERLQLRKQISTIGELENILRQDPMIIAEIHNGRLQEKMVAEILRLPANSDRIAIVRFFRALALGDSKQKRFFGFIRDLAFRQNSPLAEYLTSPPVSEILTHPVLNVPQKIQHLNIYLQQQLCPMYAKAEEDFACQVRDLQLPPQCTISHSPSFEKDTVTLSITFNNFTDCAKIAPRLSKKFLNNTYLE
ncbi:MAG: hypothetical protein V2B20_02420 [Pseudomonadota bacterium]